MGVCLVTPPKRSGDKSRGWASLKRVCSILDPHSNVLIQLTVVPRSLKSMYFYHVLCVYVPYTHNKDTLVLSPYFHIPDTLLLDRHRRQGTL